MKLDLLQLTDVPVGTPVDHGLASGRIAFACDLVPPIHEVAAAASSGTVITPPLTLPTPGKADVVVTILGDPDGYEICYVEAVAFYQLAEPKYDVIDFDSRATRGGTECEVGFCSCTYRVSLQSRPVDAHGEE